jgi:DNA-binding XRE family transcriptional regulator
MASPSRDPQITAHSTRTRISPSQAEEAESHDAAADRQRPCAGFDSRLFRSLAMTDLNTAALDVPTRDTHEPIPQLLQPADAENSHSPIVVCDAIDAIECGRVKLDNGLLRHLRQTRLMSQQDLADDCWRRNIQVSIATIKRVESGRAVRFRIARALARCFDVPVVQLLQGMKQRAASY